MKYTNSKKNIRITTNYRVFFRDVLIVLALILVIAFISTNSFGKKEFITKTYTVESSTTMWNIAQKICKDNNNLNIQNVIYDIQQVNNLENSNIYIGQELKIPVYQ